MRTSVIVVPRGRIARMWRLPPETTTLGARPRGARRDETAVVRGSERLPSTQLLSRSPAGHRRDGDSAARRLGLTPDFPITMAHHEGVDASTEKAASLDDLSPHSMTPGLERQDRQMWVRLSLCPTARWRTTGGSVARPARRSRFLRRATSPHLTPMDQTHQAS